MSQPSSNYLDRVRRWIIGGVDLERMNMRLDQKFRAQLCHEAYMFWLKDKTVRPSSLIRNIAQRHYALLLKQAALGQEEAQAYVDALHIVEGVPRTGNEIANDIYVLNWMVRELSVSAAAVHKAMYEDNAYWLSRFGRNTGDWRAVAKANEQLAKINNDFKETDNPEEQMPNTNINITGDVSIILPDRQTKDSSEIENLRKKYGLTQKEMTQQLEEIDGVWQSPDDEEPQDIFIEAEQP